MKAQRTFAPRLRAAEPCWITLGQACLVVITVIAAW